MAAGGETGSVSENEGAPKPLLLSSEDQIVSSNVHPTQNVLAVGDIAGKLTVYYFECMLLSTFTKHLFCLGIPSEQVRSAVRFAASLHRLDTPVG